MRAATLALLLCAATPVVRAQGPVIGPGQEADVMALFQPHELGGEVVPGWTLHSIQIDRATITVGLRSASGDRMTRVVLTHPRGGGGGASSASFALTEGGGAEGAEAREAVIRALRRNDDGAFWEEHGTVPRQGSRPSADGWLSAADVPRIVRSTPFWTVSLAVLAMIAIAATLVRRRRRSTAVDQRGSSTRRSAAPSSGATSDKQGGNTSSE